MKKALVVGIDYYENGSQLDGCVDDAHSLRAVLERNGNGTINFECKILTGTGQNDKVLKCDLMTTIKELFSDDKETVLFYFSGHGSIDSSGGYIFASDSSGTNDGIPLSTITTLSNKSRAKNKIIILDCCFSGSAGANPENEQSSILSEGTTILTASTADQYAVEEDGHGIFTNLLIDALQGSAANITGAITPGSVYAHIDQSLGSWDQRPVFKTNVKEFISLRDMEPQIPLGELRRIIEFFPEAGYHYKLDPTYEPEMRGRDEGLPPPDQNHTQIFSILQKFNRLNLAVPVDAPHMWHAAMESKSCRLTALGEHYRRLVRKGRI